jgi:hypothetical protein
MPDECEECEGCAEDPKIAEGRVLIREAIEKAVARVSDQTGMCTGWYVVAEFQEIGGRYGLFTASGDGVDRSLPPWRVSGLVDASIS